VATFRSTPSFAIETRERLFDATAYLPDASWRGFGAAPDDQRFIMITGVSLDATARSQSSLVLVENFFAELEARVRP
jgi:hypothetical protein